MPSAFNALNPTDNINSIAEQLNQQGPGVINPELFYTKQLLETIRYGADEYPYYRLADTTPIPDTSDKLQLRRWAPLQAHTEPLVEGIPPMSDKASVETYTIGTNQYGRYMEFTDKVDFRMIDPIISIYSKEYSIVAVETLDILARDTLLMVAQKFFANQKANITQLAVGDIPTIADLRLIVLSLKRALVKPRTGKNYMVVTSPEVIYDLISDPFVEKYMRYNNTTKPMYDSSSLVPMFNLEFYESLVAYNSGEYVGADGRLHMRLIKTDSAGVSTYADIDELGAYFSRADGYVKDPRTGQNASFIPHMKTWDIDQYNADQGSAVSPTLGYWREFKIHHAIIVGKDALIRTGMSGQDGTKMYVKPKGSAGVLDPIDQRQSIGFKINSVGFGSARPEAVVDYMCVPTHLN